MPVGGIVPIAGKLALIIGTPGIFRRIDGGGGNLIERLPPNLIPGRADGDILGLNLDAERRRSHHMRIFKSCSDAIGYFNLLAGATVKGDLKFERDRLNVGGNLPEHGAESDIALVDGCLPRRERHAERGEAFQFALRRAAVFA